MTLAERMDAALEEIRKEMRETRDAIARLEGAVGTRTFFPGPPARPDYEEDLLFRLHIVNHKCAERGGFGNCPAAMALFRKLKPEDQVLIG